MQHDKRYGMGQPATRASNGLELRICVVGRLAAGVIDGYKAAWQKIPPLIFVPLVADKPANGKASARIAWPGTR